jgi:hypothetical protein
MQSAESGADWFSGLDRDTQGWLENKGWSGDKSLPEVIKAHRSLESLVGRDKLPLPKDERDVEGWNRVYDKLGRPASWKEYGIEAGEGQNGELLGHVLQMFHREGVSAKAARNLVSGWDEITRGMEQSGNEAFARDSEAELNSLRREWGADADRRFGAAQRAGIAFGVDQGTMEKIERAIGTRTMLDLFARIGDAVSEDRGSGGGGASGWLTPEAANARLVELRGDKDWTKRYFAGDKSAIAEYDRLISAVASRG